MWWDLGTVLPWTVQWLVGSYLVSRPPSRFSGRGRRKALQMVLVSLVERRPVLERQKSKKALGIQCKKKSQETLFVKLRIWTLMGPLAYFIAGYLNKVQRKHTCSWEARSHTKLKIIHTYLYICITSSEPLSRIPSLVSADKLNT